MSEFLKVTEGDLVRWINVRRISDVRESGGKLEVSIEGASGRIFLEGSQAQIARDALDRMTVNRKQP